MRTWVDSWLWHPLAETGLLETLLKSTSRDEAYDAATLRRGLSSYFTIYNGRRRHGALGKQTPDVVFGGESIMPDVA